MRLSTLQSEDNYGSTATIADSPSLLSNFSVFIRVKPQQFSLKLADRSSLLLDQNTSLNTTTLSMTPIASASHSTVINIDDPSNSLTVFDSESRNIDQREKLFCFDGVLKDTASNEDTFTRAVLPSLPHLLQGFNATFFAYGITGSGKTHTIFGDQGGRQIRSTPDPGICVLAISHLFQHLNPATSSVTFSYLEIYNENVRDLLASNTSSSSASSNCLPKNLTIIEDPYAKTISVQDLKEYPVSSAVEVERLIERGNQTRALAPTLSNTYSSRSHAILILQIIQRISPEQVITSKLTIIDLAGSEKSSLHKLGSFEGSNINKSLLALGNCISILSDKKRANQHVPYRDSKLTRILKDSLGGNTKTVMIACISQAPSSIDETLNTLNYAQRATNIKRKVHKNITTDLDPIAQRELIADLQAQLLICRTKLLDQNAMTNKSGGSRTASSDIHQAVLKKIIEERECLRREVVELERQLAEVDGHMNGSTNGSEDEGDFLTRICDDLFQNVKESFQLTQGLSDIEAQLIRDYQELLVLRKQQNTSEMIAVVTESIAENEEIQDRMRAVLNTNANQNANLKLILHKITHNPLAQLKADLAWKRQRIETLDTMEEKTKMEIRCEMLENQLLESKLNRPIESIELELKQHPSFKSSLVVKSSLDTMPLSKTTRWDSRSSFEVSKKPTSSSSQSSVSLATYNTNSGVVATSQTAQQQLREKENNVTGCTSNSIPTSAMNNEYQLIGQIDKKVSFASVGGSTVSTKDTIDQYGLSSPPSNYGSTSGTPVAPANMSVLNANSRKEANTPQSSIKYKHPVVNVSSSNDRYEKLNIAADYSSVDKKNYLSTNSKPPTSTTSKSPLNQSYQNRCATVGDEPYRAFVADKNIYARLRSSECCDSAAKINPLEAENELVDLNNLQQQSKRGGLTLAPPPAIPACSIDLNSISSFGFDTSNATRGLLLQPKK